jgi:hypothetical protein
VIYSWLSALTLSSRRIIREYLYRLWIIRFPELTAPYRLPPILYADYSLPCRVSPRHSAPIHDSGAGFPDKSETSARIPNTHAPIPSRHARTSCGSRWLAPGHCPSGGPHRIYVSDRCRTVPCPRAISWWLKDTESTLFHPSPGHRPCPGALRHMTRDTRHLTELA